MKNIPLAALLLLAIFTAGSAYASEKIPTADRYKLSIDDVLVIQVYEEPDLSGNFEINENGAITYPLLGSIKAADLTRTEFENALTRALGEDYLINPYVHVSVKSYHERNIMILGCVQKPGSHPFPDDNNLTLLQAIAKADGFTGFAAINGTKIIRSSPDGKKVSIDPRINDIMSGKRKDVALEPDDLVFVPERLF